jgi:single-strand DNA-binding protein
MLKLLVIGNLGKDAIVNTLQSGQSVINFSVAHTENYKDKDGVKQQKTTWIDCAWWTDKHAVVPYLKKGTQIYLEGTAEVKTFSKQDVSTGTSLGCRVLMVQLIGGASNSNGQSNEQGKPTAADTGEKWKPAPAEATGATNDDLPF